MYNIKMLCSTVKCHTLKGKYWQYCTFWYQKWTGSHNAPYWPLKLRNLDILLAAVNKELYFYIKLQVSFLHKIYSNTSCTAIFHLKYKISYKSQTQVDFKCYILPSYLYIMTSGLWYMHIYASHSKRLACSGSWRSSFISRRDWAPSSDNQYGRFGHDTISGIL